MATLDDHIIRIHGAISDIQRRLDGMIQRGQVHSVDPDAGTVRLRLGGTDDKPFLGPDTPYAQMAGALKLHSPPSVGQQMTMLSATGDFRQAIAIPMTWSDANASPSNKGDEHVLTFGSVTAAIRDKQVVVQIGGASLNITDEKISISIGGTSFELSGSGIKAAASDYEWN